MELHTKLVHSILFAIAAITVAVAVSNFIFCQNIKWAPDMTDEPGYHFYFYSNFYAERNQRKHSTILCHFILSWYRSDVNPSRGEIGRIYLMFFCSFSLGLRLHSIDRFNYSLHICWPFAYRRSLCGENCLCILFISMLCFACAHFLYVPISKTTDFYWNFIGFRCFRMWSIRLYH